MPLLKEWNVGNTGLAAIWKIEENEAFFAAYTGMHTDIKNQKKRTEHLASRFLLRYLKKDFPILEIKRDEHNKPHLNDNSFYFSVSHSWPYVAAIIDSQRDTGIDIQTWNPRIIDIQRKFLSPAEQMLFGNNREDLTLAWCAKESVYKWYGKKGVDFIRHMPIGSFNKLADKSEIFIDFQLSQVPVRVELSNFVEADYACSFIKFARLL